MRDKRVFLGPIYGKDFSYHIIVDPAEENDTYGIEILDLADHSVSFHLSDISEDLGIVQQLILLMAQEDVEPFHALNVIEDYLAGCYLPFC